MSEAASPVVFQMIRLAMIAALIAIVLAVNWALRQTVPLLPQEALFPLAAAVLAFAWGYWFGERSGRKSADNRRHRAAPGRSKPVGDPALDGELLVPPRDRLRD